MPRKSQKCKSCSSRVSANARRRNSVMELLLDIWSLWDSGAVQGEKHGHVRACFSEENLFCFSEKPPTLPLSFSRGPSCCSLPSVLICSGSVCHEAQAPQPTGSPGVRPALQQLVNRSGKSPIYRGSHCKWTPRAECRSLDAVTLGNSVHVLQGEMTLALGPPASGKVPWDGFTFWVFFYHLNRDDWV